MHASLRGWLAPLLLLPLAACGDDDGSGPDRLTAGEVAGVYSVCQLTFVPEGGLASVAIPQVAFESQASGVQPPALRVDPLQEIQLVYTPKGGFVSQDLRGTFQLSGADGVTLRFDDRGTVRRGTLLLPERTTLRYTGTPQALVSTGGETYTVPRADYARLSGQSETNLAEQIRGSLTASFRAGGCG